jgi:hypothetical protein
MHFEKMQMFLESLKEVSEELGVKIFVVIDECSLKVLVIHGDKCKELLIYLNDIWPIRIGDLKPYARQTLVLTVKSLDEEGVCQITAT